MISLIIQSFNVGLCFNCFRIQDLSAGYFEQGPVHMHIYGSFSDTRGYGEELLYAILRKYILSQQT